MSLSTFFLHGLKNISTTGSLFVSSEHLAKAMTKGLAIDDVKTVVELGPGVGGITPKLLEQFSDTAITLIEFNKTFCEYLRLEYGLLVDVVEGCATQIDSIPDSSVDFICSSLPLNNMPSDLVTKILNLVKCKLKPGGMFRQYQYLGFKHKSMDLIFTEMMSETVLINLPPAVVYSWIKPRVAPLAIIDESMLYA